MTWNGVKSPAPVAFTHSPWRDGRPVRRGLMRCPRSSRWCSGTRDPDSAPNWSTSIPPTSESACGYARCSATFLTPGSRCCGTDPMFETVQQLLRARMHDDGPAVACGEKTWTWREHLAEAAAEASVVVELADPSRPLHVGALLGNSPAMLRSMA